MVTYNKYKPKNKIAAQTWNKYNNENIWDWIKIRFWPKNLAEAVCEQKLNYQTRWQLFLYLVGNGMEPLTAMNEILKMGANYFDQSAKSHLSNLLRDLIANKNKWKYWDEEMGRTTYIGETLVTKEVKKATYKIDKNVRKENIDEENKNFISDYNAAQDVRKAWEAKYPERDWFTWYSDEE